MLSRTSWIFIAWVLYFKYGPRFFTPIPKTLNPLYNHTMALSIGIVGLPNVGKSTLFNALLKRQAALAANYPFATIEPNIGIVDVPDERLQILSKIVQNDFGTMIGSREVPEKIIPAVIKFYDIAGLVKGASQGEGLGNEFLGHIREVDAIIQVVRSFEDENVIRAGSTDPQSDAETINTELILADLSVLEKKIKFLPGEIRAGKDKDILQKERLYNLVLNAFNENKMANMLNLSDEEKMYLKDLNLLTIKPMIYVLNVSEQEVQQNYTQKGIVGSYDNIRISAKIESELSVLDENDRLEYMKEFGMSESGLDRIIKKCYDLLGLQTYLTAGPKEIRAWTIKKGDTAPKAAGKIHTDFERGFISAEIVNYDALKEVMSMKIAKEKGLVRLEGKTYVMHDGDVVEFNFNV